MKKIVRRPRRLAAGIAALATAAAALVPITLAGPAAAATTCSGYSSSSSACVSETATIGGSSYTVDWYLPTSGASALMVLQNGFSRTCANVRGTSKAIAESGVMVMCVNADMTAGNPALAAALADTLSARGITPPNGATLPVRYIAGGHSAGGHFASALGAELVANGYADFAGAILFDPVAADGFSENLKAVSQNGARPVLAVAARPSVTNLFNNAYGALADLGADYVGVQLVWTGYRLGMPYGGSCHVDVEGENTDIIGIAGALCSPNATQTARLRSFATAWAKDLATGTTTASHRCTDADDVSTCGTYVRSLVSPSSSLPLAAVIPAS